MRGCRDLEALVVQVKLAFTKGNWLDLSKIDSTILTRIDPNRNTLTNMQMHTYKSVYCNYK